MRRVNCYLIVGLLACSLPSSALALITGGVGNKPLDDPGWPQGAVAIFNHPGRVAWWEGPPYGGGQWRSECRGTAKDLSGVLEKFATLDVKNKRVVVHDGVGHSFWLAPNREPEKREGAKVDWIFMIWQPERWQSLRGLPVSLNPINHQEASVPSQIDVFTGSLKWSDVVVPKGLEVVDERLEAHGFSLSDGVVVEGVVRDATYGKPMRARVELQKITSSQRAGRQAEILAQTTTDAQGRWVIKQAPSTWNQILIMAEGYAARIVGYGSGDPQPRWYSFTSDLAPLGVVSGMVVDQGGKPLADAAIRFDDIQATSGGRYEMVATIIATTDAQGLFSTSDLPVGSTTLHASKKSFVMTGLGVKAKVPSHDHLIQLFPSSTLTVTVDFGGRPKPPNYLLQLEPEGGNKPGTYGGVGNISDESKLNFLDIPPGRYVIIGRPNPGSKAEESEAVIVEFKGKEDRTLTLKAR